MDLKTSKLATVLSLNLLLILIVVTQVAQVGSQQTYPYVTFFDQTLTNHSYLDATQIGETVNTTLYCITDLSTCCSAIEGAHRGDWYFPDGIRVEFSAHVYERRHAQNVSLRHDGVFTIPTGLYRCYISTIAVHDVTNNSVRDTIYVGLYSDTGGAVSISTAMTLTVLSDLHGPDPQFTFTCISTDGPATNVFWTRDGVTITEGNKTVLNDTETAQYIHTLTLTGRLPGFYICTVSNNKPSSASQGYSLIAAAAPTDLEASHTNSNEIQLSWTLPSPNINTGYVIYYTNTTEGSTTASVTINGGSVSEYTLTGLSSEAGYNVTIVGTSEHFSSDPISIYIACVGCVSSSSMNLMPPTTTSVVISSAFECFTSPMPSAPTTTVFIPETVTIMGSCSQELQLMSSLEGNSCIENQSTVPSSTPIVQTTTVMVTITSSCSQVPQPTDSLEVTSCNEDQSMAMAFPTPSIQITTVTITVTGSCSLEPQPTVTLQGSSCNEDQSSASMAIAFQTLIVQTTTVTIMGTCSQELQPMPSLEACSCNEYQTTSMAFSTSTAPIVQTTTVLLVETRTITSSQEPQHMASRIKLMAISPTSSVLVDTVTMIETVTIIDSPKLLPCSISLEDGSFNEGSYNEDQSMKLDIGTAAGIGVGVAIAIITLAGAGILMLGLFRKYRQRRKYSLKTSTKNMPTAVNMAYGMMPQKRETVIDEDNEVEYDIVKNPFAEDGPRPPTLPRRQLTASYEIDTPPNIKKLRAKEKAEQHNIDYYKPSTVRDQKDDKDLYTQVQNNF